MQRERNELIRIISHYIDDDKDVATLSYYINQFIIEDRKRIVEPLVKVGSKEGWRIEELINATLETLKNARIGE